MEATLKRALISLSEPSDGGQRLRFERPVRQYSVEEPGGVLNLIAAAEAEALRGRWVIMALCYEAAAAFDDCLVTHRHGATGLPLAIAASFEAPSPGPEERTNLPGTDSIAPVAWSPLVSKSSYESAFAAVKEWLLRGHTYQVNLTFPLQAEFTGDDLAWFEEICRAQGSGYFFHLDLGSQAILSVSPELFFRRSGALITTRPMKGTIGRGRWFAEDVENALRLLGSDKERAENAMIVDMMRNDLGRIARPGSVTVASLFDVERYPTLLQMTSTVQAETEPETRLVDIFKALFPSSSVTGAPKPRTMELIAELEPHPRGVYTGAVGLIRPGGDCTFNVAIRTAVVDRLAGRVRYDVGSGVTWDSTERGEYEECVLKSRVTDRRMDEFLLLETLRLENGRYRLLGRHLSRLAGSAAYFGFRVDVRAALEALRQAADRAPTGALIVRLLVDRNGRAVAEVRTLPETSERPLRLAVCRQPVDSGSPFLYHKTTQREVYERALAGAPNADDVLLINERGELTESTRANLVIERRGTRLTPPLDAGLLPGTMRAELLSVGGLIEAVITPEDLAAADAVWLINSVRGWMPVDTEAFGCARHSETGR